MEPHRRIMEQIITLLTLLASILAVLRQAENVDLHYKRTAEHMQEERVETIPAQPVSKVKTRVR
jgi:hypothetical protein